jgi:hypothetical protein
LDHVCSSAFSHLFLVYLVSIANEEARFKYTIAENKHAIFKDNDVWAALNRGCPEV